jgi:hypothetical protein
MEETSREVERTPGVRVDDGLPEDDDDNKLSEECGWMLDQAAWSTGQAAVASLRWLTGHVPVSCGDDMTNVNEKNRVTDSLNSRCKDKGCTSHLNDP